MNDPGSVLIRINIHNLDLALAPMTSLNDSVTGVPLFFH
jgi:hypothetical protein